MQKFLIFFSAIMAVLPLQAMFRVPGSIKISPAYPSYKCKANEEINRFRALVRARRAVNGYNRLDVKGEAIRFASKYHSHDEIYVAIGEVNNRMRKLEQGLIDLSEARAALFQERKRMQEQAIPQGLTITEINRN